MTDDGEITISVQTLGVLLSKAKTAGWEVASGYVTDQQACSYIRGVVHELTGVRVTL